MTESQHTALQRKFKTRFGSVPDAIFAAPGRTELGGNHTDHNNGKVLAASVDLDMKGAVARTSGRIVRVYSEELEEEFNVELGDLSIHPGERGTSAGLIRGVAAFLSRHGCVVEGCNIYVESLVSVGSGLSSSACFEVLMGTIFNDLFGKGALSPEQIALAGRFAENEYFGKPCGLMDQLTCSVGGTLRIDLRDPMKPVVDKIAFDPGAHGYSLVVVNTGSDHADLTEDYAAIPAEMRSVAALFGVPTLREIPSAAFYDRLAEIRKRCGDRAALRSMHYLEENERVDREFEALGRGDFAEFLRNVQKSGDSSMKWLQNSHAGRNPADQSVTLALAVADRFLSGIGKGAYRIHGGGFAGTIQAYLPSESVDDFEDSVTRVFGRRSVVRLLLCKEGARKIDG